ncbi:hypothetical protein PsYK624_134660 [Phanerochaete sordida]|uniref:Uncharacterized protein n=1 Tax=Phanerochaete sordida TaxID=48140 RepID=A0A9P3GL31_9APHY|nr:hypothetical protein PsYK624_134660 [Phanerochaete sordida]
MRRSHTGRPPDAPGDAGKGVGLLGRRFPVDTQRRNRRAIDVARAGLEMGIDSAQFHPMHHWQASCILAGQNECHGAVEGGAESSGASA